MMIFSLFLILILLSPGSAVAEQHAIEREETALQIAIDHNLTMAQLSQLNPGVDLEMMRIGDLLTIPDEGMSFEEFLNRYYSNLLEISDINCDTLADQSVNCFFNVENISDSALFDICLKLEVNGENGTRSTSENTLSLMQISPHEKIPAVLSIPAMLSDFEKASVTVTNLSRLDAFEGSFRIPDDFYTQTVSFLPDHAIGKISIQFSEDAAVIYGSKKINVLAAAYDENRAIIGLRSMYTDFYPSIEITLYTNSLKIQDTALWLEAY